MLKRLAILGILLAAMPPMPGQPVKPAAQGGEKSQRQGNKAVTIPEPSLVSKPIDPGTAKSNGEPRASEDREHSVKLSSLPPVTLTDKTKTFRDEVLDWGPWIFNFLLVVVGALQIWLLFRTWRTIDRQADLQEIAYTQWLVIKTWHSAIKDEKVPQRYTDGSPVIRLGIQFQIINESQFPITLSDSEIVFKTSRVGEVGGLKYYAPQNFPLFPNVPYMVDVSVVVTKEEIDQFETSIMLISVEGKFTWTGVLKEKRVQTLHGLLWCGKAETRFDEQIPARAEEVKP